MLYDIDGEHSVKNIHGHPGKGYASTPGASTIDLQRNQSLRKMSLMMTLPKKAVISPICQDTN